MKKRYYTTLTLLLLLAISFPKIIFAAYSLSFYPRGDANKDTRTDNLDAALILRYDAGLFPLTEEEMSLGDYNEDGFTDNLDASQILSYDAKAYEAPTDYPPRKQFEVEFIGQEPYYPCGCEGISAIMLMRYHGIEVETKDFFDKALDTFPFTYDWRSNTYYGEDMDRYYVGDPTSELGKGCFAPVIKSAIEKLAPEKYIAVIEQGVTVAELTDKYLKRLDRPILIWATSGMRDSFSGTKWKVARNNSYCTFPAYMHCLVLVGYDDAENLYYFNDPWKNSGLVAFDKDLVEAKFKELGSQALAILTKEEYRAGKAKIDYTKPYALRNAATGKYISIKGNNLIQNVVSDNDSLQFFIKKHDDGSVSFINKESGKAISINGRNAELNTYDGSSAQRFYITENENGFITIAFGKSRDTALAAYGNYNGDEGKTSTSPGNVYLNTVPENYDFYQLWELVLV